MNRLVDEELELAPVSSLELDVDEKQMEKGRCEERSAGPGQAAPRGQERIDHRGRCQGVESHKEARYRGAVHEFGRLT